MKRKNGFTLIELLIVIAIVAVLSSLLFANFSGARERARDAKRKGDLDQIKKALRLYYNDNQAYPPLLTFGTSFGAGATVYMNEIPSDPLVTAQDVTKQYVYNIADNDSDKFTIRAILENASDPEIAKSQARCPALDNGSWTATTDYVVCAD